MTLPVFEIGSTMTVEERWHDLLWSAVPHHVVSSTPAELVTYVPSGTIATRASNRDLPGTEGLSRDERKLLSLRTRQARVVEVAEAPNKLFIHRPGRWSRTSLGWDHAGALISWYINFELPAAVTRTGLVTMDLTVDIWVNPDRTWEWKDREDFLALLDDHTLDPGVRAHVDAEAIAVLTELHTRTGPFADHWLRFQPNPDWATPALPPSHAWRGTAWSLPTGPARL